MKAPRFAGWVSLALAAMLLSLAPAASADYLVVSRPATVKAHPDRGAEILRRYDDGDVLMLVSGEQENGYYEVEIPGDSGWIYRTLARRHRGVPNDLPASQARSGLLEVHVIDVGQGDAILIRCPDGEHEMLIDSGDNRYPGSMRQLRAYLEKHQDRGNPIEVAVATHPHADHIGSMDWVLRAYNVDLYVDNGNAYDSATWRRVEAAWADSSAAYWSAQDELPPDVDFCPQHDVDAVVLVPEGFGSFSDPNDNSVVVRIDYADASFLFTGDAEGEAERQLLEDPATMARLDVDFLKVGHHGSLTSSADEFLDAVTPRIAAISCGAPRTGTNSRYRHPRRRTVLELLPRLDARLGEAVDLEVYNTQSETWEFITLDRALYVTSAEGDLVFESDGEFVRVRAE